jgi:hypothetical protein
MDIAELNRRIRADHAAAVSFFTNKLGCAARAFFFPMGNYGQFEAHNKPLREANLKAVEDFYEMGFIIDDFGYNNALSDPRRLARLKVDPAWSADELVRILDGVWPREIPGGWNDPPEAGGVEKERWRAIWGECMPGADGSSVYLRAKAPVDPVVSDKGSTTGAKALVMEALEKLNRESGITIVMISSELEELRQICDRIAIVSGGRIAGILPATEPSEAFGELMVSSVV